MHAPEIYLPPAVSISVDCLRRWEFSLVAGPVHCKGRMKMKPLAVQSSWRAVCSEANGWPGDGPGGAVTYTARRLLVARECDGTSRATESRRLRSTVERRQYPESRNGHRRGTRWGDGSSCGTKSSRYVTMRQSAVHGL